MAVHRILGPDRGLAADLYNFLGRELGHKAMNRRMAGYIDFVAGSVIVGHKLVESDYWRRMVVPGFEDEILRMLGFGDGVAWIVVVVAAAAAAAAVPVDGKNQKADMRRGVLGRYIHLVIDRTMSIQNPAPGDNLLACVICRHLLSVQKCCGRSRSPRSSPTGPTVDIGVAQCSFHFVHCTQRYDLLGFVAVAVAVECDSAYFLQADCQRVHQLCCLLPSSRNAGL